MEAKPANVEIFHHTQTPLVIRAPGSPWNDGQDLFIVKTDRDLCIPQREERVLDTGTSLHLPRGLILIRTPIWESVDIILADPAPIIGLGHNIRLTFRLRNTGSRKQTFKAHQDLFHLVFLRSAPTTGRMHYPSRGNQQLAFTGLTTVGSHQQEGHTAKAD